MLQSVEVITINQPKSWLRTRFMLVQKLLPRMPLSIAFVALIALQSLLLSLFQFGNQQIWVDALINLGTLPILFVTAYLSWRVAARQPQTRLTQMGQLLMLAYFAAAIGNILQFVFTHLIRMDAAQSPAIGFNLLFYPIFLVALNRSAFAFPQRADLWKFVLDASIIIISCCTMLWYFVLAPVSSSQNATLVWPQVIYSIGDLILLVYILAMLIRQGNVYLRLSLQLLALGLLLHAVSNTIHTRELLGGNLEHSRLLSQVQLLVYLPFLVSAEFEYRRLTQSIRIDHDLTPTRGFSILPYVGMLVTLILMLRLTIINGDRALLIPMLGAVLLGFTVMLRLLSAVRESAQLSAQRVVSLSEARFQSLVQHSSDIIAILDDKLCIRFVSPSVTRILGYHPEQLIGESYANLLASDEQTAVSAVLQKAFQHTGDPTSATWRLRSSRGRYLYAESTITNLVNDPNIKGLVLNTRDLTEREELESQLTHLAFHDSLTSLANRSLFQQQLEFALIRQRRSNHRVAIIFLDLDNFKEVNDTLGHDRGNTLLVEVSERLRQFLDRRDAIARLGGDEFAILLEDIHDEAQVQTIAQQVKALFQIPFFLDTHETVITASMGIAISQPGDAPSDVLRNADVAMYAAKFGGGDRYALFETDMHQQMIRRKAMRDDLRRAISSGQFALQYQPIVSLDTEEIVGAEALLRWTHPDQGTLSPGEFIALAEENGMIVPIGHWVMQQVFQDAARWQRAAVDHAALLLTINLSSRQLREPHFVKDVQALMEKSGVDPNGIMFEITETILVENTVPALDVLTQLRALGVRLGIDDFGTGYSSLSYLQRMSLDMIKIARSFVERVGEGEDNYALAQAIFSMGKSLRLIVIAEGIETAQQLRLLRELGCDWAQGYYFAQPMPADEFAELVSNRRNTGQIAFPGLPWL